MRRRRGELADAWLWSGCALYAAVFIALGIVRYRAHHNLIDLGVFSQVTASAFGCFCNALYGSQWAHHFSPILYVPGAFMQIWRSALTLVVIQAIAAALFVPAVYALVFRHTDRKTARLAAVVAFLYPPLAGMVFGDFYENAFAPAAVAWMLWAFDGEYFGAAFAFALLTLSIKEDQAFFLIAAGLIGAWHYRDDRHRRQTALLIAGISVVIASVYLFDIRPHALGANPQWTERFFSWNAQTLRGLIPMGILQRAGFVVLAFAPLLFLPFRTPVFLIALLPLAEVLASSSPVTFTIGQHYAGAWLGYVFYAFANAVCVKWRSDPGRMHRALYFCIAICVMEFAVADPLHPGLNLNAYEPRDAALDRFLARLPANIDVATQEEAYTHIAATDPNATLLPPPDGSINSCYILTDWDYPKSVSLVWSREIVARLARSGIYRVARRDGNITLYKKRAPCR